MSPGAGAGTRQGQGGAGGGRGGRPHRRRGAAPDARPAPFRSAPDDEPAAGRCWSGPAGGSAGWAPRRGLTVRFGVFGDPVPVPESVSQAAYRVVQEAVTNTLKHARARTARRPGPLPRLEMEVDVSRRRQGGPPGEPAGLGLVGMRERVTAHDGSWRSARAPAGLAGSGPVSATRRRWPDGTGAGANSIRVLLADDHRPGARRVPGDPGDRGRHRRWSARPPTASRPST